MLHPDTITKCIILYFYNYILKLLYSKSPSCCGWVYSQIAWMPKMAKHWFNTMLVVCQLSPIKMIPWLFDVPFLMLLLCCSTTLPGQYTCKTIHTVNDICTCTVRAFHMYAFQLIHVFLRNDLKFSPTYLFCIVILSGQPWVWTGSGYGRNPDWSNKPVWLC